MATENARNVDAEYVLLDPLLSGTVLSAAAYLTGGVDDSSGLNAAAEAARDLGVTLYIPAVDVHLQGRVTIYGSFRSDGRVIVDGAGGGLDFVRQVAPVTIDPAILPPMNKGTYQLTGVPGAGTLVIKSSEQLILRNNAGVSSTYTKQETVKVARDGAIMPALTASYDKARITSILFYPEERATYIDGLEVVAEGSALTSLDNMVLVQRTNVTINGVTGTNSATGLGPHSFLRIQDSTNVFVNAPSIRGFSRDGSGYGIAKYLTSNLVINDPDITECRHGVTGRYDNNVTINRGMVRGIDTHWGWNLVLNDVTYYGVDGASCVTVAGGNLTVRGGVYNGARNFVGVRLDTPEFSGVISVRDVVWTPGASTGAPTPWVVGYSSLSDSASTFNFGRVLDFADIEIDNVEINLTTARACSGVNMGVMSFQRRLPRRVSVSRLRVSNPGTDVLPVQMGANDLTLQDGKTAISVNDVSCPATTNGGIRVTVGTLSTDRTFDYVVTRVDNISLRIPVNLTGILDVSRSTLVQLMTTASVAATPKGSYTIRDSTIKDATFNGLWRGDFIDNEWAGTITNTNHGTNGRCQSFIGNRVRVGTVGAPTLADGYRDSSVYSS